MSNNEPQPQFPSNQPTRDGLMGWLRQLASWGRSLSHRLQLLEDAPPSTQVFTSYNWNDPSNQPDKPPQDGDGDGWARVSDPDAVWMSQKVAPSIYEGEWGTPTIIKGSDGHSALRVAILSSDGTVFHRSSPDDTTTDPSTITLSLLIYYGTMEINVSDLDSITWTFPDGSTASTQTVDVTAADINGQDKMKVEVSWEGIAGDDEITLVDVSDGATGDAGPVISHVFKRAWNQPDTPSGGTYSDPVPSGWSDGIPPDSDQGYVWMSEKKFTSDGEGDTSWSEPLLYQGKFVVGEDGVRTMYSFHANDITNPPSKPIGNGTNGDWHYPAQPGDVWMSERTAPLPGTNGPVMMLHFVEQLHFDSSWSEPTAIAGESGPFVEYVFQRNATQPSTPSGGTYEDPLPDSTDWSDTVPTGSEPLWMSKKKYVKNGANGSWSEPTQFEGITANVFSIYSDDKVTAIGTSAQGETDPAPSSWWSDETHWKQDIGSYPDDATIWRMAITRYESGAWTAWQVSQIKGERGEQGESFTVDDSGPAADKPDADETHHGYHYHDTDNQLLYTAIGDPDEAKMLLDFVAQTYWEDSDGSKGLYWDSGVDFGKGDPGPYTEYIFKRADTKPATPSGGTYDDPLLKNSTGGPSDDGWTDGVPDGEKPLWTSKKKYVYSDSDADTWSEPVRIEGEGAGIFQVFSNAESGDPPKDPTDYTDINPLTWWDDTADDNWKDSVNDFASDAKIYRMAVTRYENRQWTPWEVSTIKGEDGLDGQDGVDGQFTSHVFQRSDTKPSTPSGGTYSDPVPTGWSDAIPTGEKRLWMSEAVFTEGTSSPSWSEPTQFEARTVQGEAGISVQRAFSSAEANRGEEMLIPTSDLFHAYMLLDFSREIYWADSNSVWHWKAVPGDVWSAEKKGPLPGTNGASMLLDFINEVHYDSGWSDVQRIKGEKGEDALYAALDFEQLMFRVSGDETTITPDTITGSVLAFSQGAQLEPGNFTATWHKKESDGSWTQVATGKEITVGHSSGQSGIDTYVDGKLQLKAVVAYDNKTAEVAETLYDVHDGAGLSILYTARPNRPDKPEPDANNWTDQGWHGIPFNDAGDILSELGIDAADVNWLGANNGEPSSPSQYDAYADTSYSPVRCYIYVDSSGNRKRVQDAWRSEKIENTSQWGEPEKVVGEKGNKGDEGTPGQNTYTAYYPHSNKNDKPSTPSRPPSDLTPSNSPQNGWYWDQDTAANNGYVWFLSIKGSRYEPGDSDWSNDVWSEPIQIRGEKGASYKNYQPTTTGDPIIEAYANDDSGELVEKTLDGSNLTSLPQIPSGWHKESLRYVIRFDWYCSDDLEPYVELWIGGQQVFYGDQNGTNGEEQETIEMDDANYPHDVYVEAYNGAFSEARIAVKEIIGEVMVTDE